MSDMMRQRRTNSFVCWLKLENLLFVVAAIPLYDPQLLNSAAVFLLPEVLDLGILSGDGSIEIDLQKYYKSLNNIVELNYLYPDKDFKTKKLMSDER